MKILMTTEEIIERGLWEEFCEARPAEEKITKCPPLAGICTYHGSIASFYSRLQGFSGPKLWRHCLGNLDFLAGAGVYSCPRGPFFNEK